ncbi:MAG: hypothetical protein IKR34_02045 [Candidatus Gastranaerophilales bacterium]|nr:hypothetical protein [Elusimicrobiota bacterium]MBR6298005.1 hypothetical protein [Candidatus Gastranaerophilales bacterium]
MKERVNFKKIITNQLNIELVQRHIKRLEGYILKIGEALNKKLLDKNKIACIEEIIKEAKKII